MSVKPFGDIIAKVRKLAELSPENVAPCHYFSEGSPFCIIGHVLADLGVKQMNQKTFLYYPDSPGYTHGDLLTADGAFFCHPNTLAFELSWEKVGYEMPSARQTAWIYEVQAGQDHGKTWGGAVTAADKEIGVL